MVFTKAWIMLLFEEGRACLPCPRPLEVTAPGSSQAPSLLLRAKDAVIYRPVKPGPNAA